MEKENVLEIEITKINDDWSAITVKKIKKDFENNDFFEWLTIGGNYLYDGKIFVNHCYPSIPFLIRNEIIEHLEEIVNKINKKYGIPKRWRAKQGEIYFFINSNCKIDTTKNYINDWDKFDDINYELGNYFKTKEEAEKVKEELDKFWAKVRAGEIGGENVEV